MGKATRVQILEESDYISHSTDTLGKDIMQLFSLHLWVNSRANWVLQFWSGNQSRKMEIEFKSLKVHFKK